MAISDITTYLNQIKSERYAKDVRLAIYNAIKGANDNSVEAYNATNTAVTNLTGLVNAAETHIDGVADDVEDTLKDVGGFRYSYAKLMDGALFDFAEDDIGSSGVPQNKVLYDYVVDIPVGEVIRFQFNSGLSGMSGGYHDKDRVQLKAYVTEYSTGTEYILGIIDAQSTDPYSGDPYYQDFTLSQVHAAKITIKSEVVYGGSALEDPSVDISCSLRDHYDVISLIGGGILNVKQQFLDGSLSTFSLSPDTKEHKDALCNNIYLISLGIGETYTINDPDRELYDDGTYTLTENDLLVLYTIPTHFSNLEYRLHQILIVFDNRDTILNSGIQPKKIFCRKFIHSASGGISDVWTDFREFSIAALIQLWSIRNNKLFAVEDTQHFSYTDNTPVLDNSSRTLIPTEDYTYPLSVPAGTRIPTTQSVLNSIGDHAFEYGTFSNINGTGFTITNGRYALEGHFCTIEFACQATTASLSYGNRFSFTLPISSVYSGNTNGKTQLIHTYEGKNIIGLISGSYCSITLDAIDPIHSIYSFKTSIRYKYIDD